MARAPRPYHHGDLRRALIDAGLAILTEGGDEALTLRAVARRAGVSHAAPAHHFSSKGALLAALAETGFERMHAALDAARAGARTPDAELLALGIAYVTFATENPALYRVMFRGDVLGATDDAARLAQVANEAYALLEDVAARAAGARPQTRRAGSAALASWALVHGLATLWTEGLLADQTPPGATAADMAVVAGRIFVDGLRASRG